MNDLFIDPISYNDVYTDIDTEKYLFRQQWILFIYTIVLNRMGNIILHNLRGYVFDIHMSVTV